RIDALHTGAIARGAQALLSRLGRQDLGNLWVSRRLQRDGGLVRGSLHGAQSSTDHGDDREPSHWAHLEVVHGEQGNQAGVGCDWVCRGSPLTRRAADRAAIWPTGYLARRWTRRGTSLAKRERSGGGRARRRAGGGMSTYPSLTKE